jgi:exodeoxyribonuclease V beta subunit
LAGQLAKGKHMSVPVVVQSPVFAAQMRGLEVIQAGAGTGKTWTLTGLVVRALLDTRQETSLLLEQILVITFTKAAAAELRARIMLRIEQCQSIYAAAARTGEYERQQDPFADQLERIALESKRTAQACADVLRLALASADAISVQTIHSFCQQLLRQFSLSTAVAPETQVSHSLEDLIRLEAANYWRSFESLDRAPLMAKLLAHGLLTPEKLLNELEAAIAHPYAQSKQTPLVWDQWLGQLDQVWQQFREAWQREGPQALERTFEVNGTAKIHRENWARLMSAAVAQDNPFDAHQKVLERFTPDLAKLNVKKLPIWTELALQFRIFPLAEALLPYLEQLAHFKIWLALGFRAQCLQALQERKLAAQVQSFDDLVEQVAQRLEESPALAQRCADAYPLILVDESQDNDAAQWRVFELMHKRSSHGLVVVGDPKQAIYSFRGADLPAFMAILKKADRSYALLENQRATPELIRATNALFLFKDVFSTQGIEFQEASKGLKPAFKLWRLGLEQFAGLTLLSGAEQYCDAKNAAGWLRAVCEQTADQLHELLADSAYCLGPTADDSRALQASDLAVLVDTGRQARAIREALGKRGVLSVIRDREHVFEQIEALWLEWLGAALADPSKREGCLAVAGLPLMGYGLEELARVKQGQSAPWLVRLQQTLIQARGLWMQDGPLSAMEFLAVEHQWGGCLQAAQKANPAIDPKRHLANLQLIIGMAQEAEPSLGSPEAFLVWLRANKKTKSDDAQPTLSDTGNLVRIVTIHASKGLEFPLVFIPFAPMARVKSAKRGLVVFKDDVLDFQVGEVQDKQEAQELALAEQVRLLYVAITRAQSACTLSVYEGLTFEKSALAKVLGCVADEKSPIENRLMVLCAALIQQVNNPKAMRLVNAAQPLSLPTLHSQNVVPAEAIPLQRYVGPAWFSSSFTSIAARANSTQSQQENKVADYDQQLNASDPQGVPALSMNVEHRLASSAVVGRAIHAVFELANWQDPIAPLLVVDQFTAFGLQHSAFEQEAKAIAHWLDQVRQLPFRVGAGSMRLSDIAPAHSLREIAFDMYLAPIASHKFQTALKEAYIIPHDAELANLPPGFLRGVMDAVVLHRGRFYVQDWKSNRLGASPSAYDADALAGAMQEHLYTLQAWIYLLALHRWLAVCLPNYDAQTHLGGALYYFVRGFANEQTQGLVEIKPSLEVLLRLDAILQGTAT